MPARIPHTYRLPTGTYYIRLLWPKPVRACYQLPQQLRHSLGTRQHAEARLRAAEHVQGFFTLVKYLQKIQEVAQILGPNICISLVCQRLRGGVGDIIETLSARGRYPLKEKEFSQMMQLTSYDSPLSGRAFFDFKDDSLEKQAILELMREEREFFRQNPELLRLIVRHRCGDESLSGAPPIDSLSANDGQLTLGAVTPSPAPACDSHRLSLVEPTAPATSEAIAGTTLVQPSPTAATGTTFEQLADLWVKNMLQRNKWCNPKTRQKYTSMVRCIVEIIGANTPVRTMNRLDHTDRFVQALGSYPSGRFLGKNAERSLVEIQALPHYQPIKPRYAEEFVQRYKAIMRHACQYGYIAQDIASDISYDVKTLPEDKRLPFLVTDVQAMLNGYLYTGHYTGDPRAFPEVYFWAPLIALFTGARLNEICQLGVGNVEVEDGIHYFQVTDEGALQSIKTPQSKRKVPIHSALIWLGFLDYVEARRAVAAPDDLLFEGIDYDFASRYGREVGRWFNGTRGQHARSGYLDGLGIDQRDQKGFHSFRHLVADRLRNADKGEAMDEAKIAALLGHDHPTVTAEYGAGFTLQTRAHLMEKIRYPELDLSHVDVAVFRVMAQRHQRKPQAAVVSVDPELRHGKG